MSPTFRYLISSLVIAAVAPVGLAVLDLEQSAIAKNSGGNGGGNGNGNGGGHGNGNGGGHGGNGGQGNGHGKQATTDDGGSTGKAHKPAKAELQANLEGDDSLESDDSLTPSALGKLNGVLHASPQAIANASINSPIGKARAFGEALSGFLSEPDVDEDETDETDSDEAETDPVTVEDLGALMAGMTNKPVSPEQVQAVVDRLAADDPENEALQDMDPALAQDIADEANAIHGFDAATDDDAPESEQPAE